jgi:hypothetical protein
MLLAKFANGSIDVKRLDLTGWAAIAEVIGTVGIVVSLIFVAYSINTNTDEVRASQTNVIFDTARHIDLSVASDSEWARIVVQGRSHKGHLSEVDQYRYDIYLVAVMDLWDQLLVRVQDGLMSEGMIVDWEIYFGEWVERHMTDSDWQRVEWQYLGDIRTKVEAALSAELPR